MLTSEGLSTDLSYSTGQFTGALSQDFLAISENNINGKDNSYRKLTQENLKFNKSEKSS